MFPAHVFWLASPCLLGQVVAQGTWVGVPITGPKRLTDLASGSFHWHYAEVQIGKPPQNHSLVVNIRTTLNLLYGPKCLFCPGERVFEPSLSKTFNATGKSLPLSLGPERILVESASESFSFGGVLDSEKIPMGLVTFRSSRRVLRFNEGLLGLYVHPTNATMNEGSILHRLSSNKNLLYPVIGLRFGGERKRLTLGALDPMDYDGQINWVEAVPTAEMPSVIPIDSLRGYQGNMLPYVEPGSLATIEPLGIGIQIPPLAYASYFMNRSLVGPQKVIVIYPGGGMSIGCNYTLENMDSSSANAPFSVDINGVNYPVDHDDMVRPQSIFSTNITCNTALLNSTTGPYSTPIWLGQSFLRSVFLAYRFPTPECPKAFYGFAFPKGATSQLLAQAPRSTPVDSGQCQLSQIAAYRPNTTPTPTELQEPPVRTLGNNVRVPLPGERTYKVYGRPNLQEVVLKDAEGLPLLDVSDILRAKSQGDL